MGILVASKAQVASFIGGLVWISGIITVWGPQSIAKLVQNIL